MQIKSRPQQLALFDADEYKVSRIPRLTKVGDHLHKSVYEHERKAAELLKLAVEDFRRYLVDPARYDSRVGGHWDYRWFMQQAIKLSGKECSTCLTTGAIPVIREGKRIGIRYCDHCEGFGYV